ncbi:MAG TPA: adenylate/guanylate cyclase domain-containing protein [Rhizomicrobium sp.]|jgi:adenylate cyclase|nr:adenylate/guanylate cyclase domain-containing protein [Rhizomicrobium sp.]
MKLGSRPIEVWAFPLIILIAAMLVLATDAGGLAGRVRGVLFDAYQHSQPRPYHDRIGKFAVRTLEADQASIARFGAWPWPRTVLAKLTSEMKSAGAAMVVFALPLDRPDPASPQQLAAGLPPGPQADAARAALSAVQSPDDALAGAMKTIPVVSGFTLQRGAGAAPQNNSVTFDGARDALSHIPEFGHAIAPLPQIEAASAASGALNLLSDSDGKVRRAALLLRVSGKPASSIEAEATRLSQNANKLIARGNTPGRSIFDNASGIATIEAGTLAIPTEPDGSIWIAYSGANAARRISAAALDSGTLPANALKDAIVIVGAPDAMVQTPDGPRNAASVRAEALENILSGYHLMRPPSADMAELIFLAIAGGTVVFLLYRFGLLWAGALTVLAIAGAGYLSWSLYSGNHVLLDSLGPGIALALTFAAGVAARGLEVGRARSRLRNAFAEALPVGALDQIARNPHLLKLEGEARTVSYLSCGIRNFSGVAESFRDDPAGFTDLVGRVLSPLVEVALAKGATLDRLTTEGFSAFWNAPLDDSEHAIHACEAASRMIEVVADVNDALSRERRFDGLAIGPIEIGVGISTGTAIAGGFGAHGRNVYSVTGDCTVLAGRIQQHSAQYGPAIIVSEDTRKGAERGFAFLEVDYIAIGAHDEPVKLYAVLGNPLVRASPKFRALSTFHEHIFQSLRTQQWEKSRGLIDQCRKLSGASPKLYDLHLARIDYFEDNPPGTDWDGAFRPILK